MQYTQVYSKNKRGLFYIEFKEYIIAVWWALLFSYQVCLTCCIWETVPALPYQTPCVSGGLCWHCPARHLLCLGGCAGNTAGQVPGMELVYLRDCTGSALREAPARVPECQGGCAGGTLGEAPGGKLVAKWCARVREWRLPPEVTRSSLWEGRQLTM